VPRKPKIVKAQRGTRICAVYSRAPYAGFLRPAWNRIYVGTLIRSLAFAQDGKSFAMAQKLLTLTKINGLRQVTFSPDGRYLAAGVSVGQEPAEVLLWDAVGGQAPATPTTGEISQ
jgi:hypothetical protein